MTERSTVADFWDGIYSTTSHAREVELPIVTAALARFGDVRGKTLVEIGCGPGAASLFFAAQGANVIAVDVSSTAIHDLNEYCARNGITNVRGVCADAFGIDSLPPADLVFGSMILHHIEPFDKFVGSLRRLVKPGGTAFFYENSAMSGLLVWFREHVVGKLWVPKKGDDEEFPLTPGEVDQIRKHFDVSIDYPELLFFGLVSDYLLRGRLRPWFGRIDAFFYGRGWLLRYSYRQFLTLRG